MKSLKKMESGKPSWLDGVAVEFLKKIDETMVKWFMRSSTACLNRGEVPGDWRISCIIS